MKKTIDCLLKQKFKNEFTQLIEIIPKLYKFLIYCKQNPENYDNLSCPDHVLSTDVTDRIKRATKEDPDIRDMTIYENYAYRNLIENEDRTEEDEIISIHEYNEMKEEEREKKFYRPFHDQDIS